MSSGIIFMLVALGISAAGMLAFIVRDAMAAFGDGPTLSSKIKAWVRQSRVHKFLLLATLWQGGLVLTWLTFHLLLQVM